VSKPATILRLSVIPLCTEAGYMEHLLVMRVDGMLGPQSFSSGNFKYMMPLLEPFTQANPNRKKFPRKIINNILPEEYRRTACIPSPFSRCYLH